MRKKISRKAKTTVKRVRSSKSLLRHTLPVRWSFISVSIMAVLALLAVVLPQSGVLGASTKKVQVDLSVAMKDKSSVKFTAPSGLLLVISQTSLPSKNATSGAKTKGQPVTKIIDKHVFYSLPSTYTFAADNGGMYTVSLIVLPGTQYTVLNGRRVVNVRNGKSECRVSSTKNNPCTFFVVSGVRKSGDLGNNEGTATAGLKPRLTVTPRPKPTVTPRFTTSTTRH